jgi:hypothetical protein
VGEEGNRGWRQLARNDAAENTTGEWRLRPSGTVVEAYRPKNQTFQRAGEQHREKIRERQQKGN